jgi:hypothetical protein
MRLVHVVRCGRFGCPRGLLTDVLPAAIAQETVITAGDELGPIREYDAVGRLRGDPLIEDGGLDAAAIEAVTHCPVDSLARLEVRDGFMPSITQQDGCIAPDAVGAGVAASAVRVDRPPERHPGGLRNPVQDRFRADLVEPRLERLGRVEMTDCRLLAIAR